MDVLIETEMRHDPALVIVSNGFTWINNINLGTNVNWNILVAFA